MANTLILYDGRQSSAERVANAIGYIIGNVRIAEIGDSPEDISVYDGFCFIFNFYGALTAGKTKSYLLSKRESLLGKRIAFVGMGFSDAGFTKYVVDMEFAVGGDLSITGMFLKDERTTSEIGYQIAKKLRAPVSVMPEDMLSREIDAFICRHTTLALSTGGGARIRCTPLEYLYLDGIFYIISEGGLKFSNILDNSNVSAAIFDEYADDAQPLAGLQMYGVAEQVVRGSDGYWQILGHKGVTPKVLRDLPVTLFVLRIVPMSYEYLNSSFANIGYDARQTLDTKFRAERWEAGYASLHAAKEAEEAEKAAANVKKEPPRRAAFMAERAVREELGQEIRNVLEENAPKKTALDEEREYQEMSEFIDGSGSVKEAGAGTEEDELFQKVARALSMSTEEDHGEESADGGVSMEEESEGEANEEENVALEVSMEEGTAIGEVSSEEGTAIGEVSTEEGTAVGEVSTEEESEGDDHEEETAAGEVSTEEESKEDDIEGEPVAWKVSNKVESAEGTYGEETVNEEVYADAESAGEIYEEETVTEEVSAKAESAGGIYGEEIAVGEASGGEESAEGVYEKEALSKEDFVKGGFVEENYKGESAGGEASAEVKPVEEIREEEPVSADAPVNEEFVVEGNKEETIAEELSVEEESVEETHEGENITEDLPEDAPAVEGIQDKDVTKEEVSVEGTSDGKTSENEVAAGDTVGEEETIAWKEKAADEAAAARSENVSNEDVVGSAEKSVETATTADAPSRIGRVEKPKYGGTRTTLGEPLYRNRQTVKDDILSESLEAQNRNLGAEIRKIFSGGGLSFEEQLERKRAEAEGISPEESEETRTAKKGIFDNEIEYRKSMPRSSSPETSREEKIEEPEEEKEPYTLEDLERDTLLAEREEEEKKAESKKETRKGLAGFFKGVTKKEVFEDETFADEFEDLDSDDLDVEDFYEDDDEKEEEVPKKKKQGGFFSTGFGRSLSRILGIGPDEDEEEEEEEDYEEELDEEDDDFDSSDESEGTEPGWMARLRERREDEDIDSDEDDFSIHGVGGRKEDSDTISAASEERDDEGGDVLREEKPSYSEQAIESESEGAIESYTEEAIESDSEEARDDEDALESEGVKEETADDEEEAEGFIDVPDFEIDAISAALLRSLEEVEKESAADREKENAVNRETGDGDSEEESESDGDAKDEITETDGQEIQESEETDDDDWDQEPEELDDDGDWEQESEELDDDDDGDWEQEPEEFDDDDDGDWEQNSEESSDDGDENRGQDSEMSKESDDDTGVSRKAEEFTSDKKQVLDAVISGDDEDWMEEPNVVKEVVRGADSHSESKETGGKDDKSVDVAETSDEEDDEYEDEFEDEDEFDYEDEDEFEEPSFITNFADLLRSAIESLRGGSSEQSDRSKIRIPGREGRGNKEKAIKEKEREDEPELVELEKFLSERGLGDSEEVEETEEAGDETVEEAVEDMEEGVDEQEDEDREYEDSDLDFADDDDSDIIIPGAGALSDQGIVIRGFDDDEDAEELTSVEDDEEEDGYQEEDWKIDYERITHKSEELHDDATEDAESDYDEADDATEDAESDYGEADDAIDDAEPDYDETEDIDGDEDWDYDDPDDDSEAGYYEFAGDDMDDLDDEDEWEYEEDGDVVDGIYEPV